MSAALARLKAMLATLPDNPGKIPYPSNPQSPQKPLLNLLKVAGVGVFGEILTPALDVAPAILPEPSTQPVDWRIHFDFDERVAIALESGKVPPLYADAFARLQCQRLPGIPQDVQELATDMAGQLLDKHGAALVILQWPVAAIFDSPLVLATHGESAALDLRKAGLVWQLREGDMVQPLEPGGAVIRCAGGNSWPFNWKPTDGR